MKPDPEIENMLVLLSALEYLEEAESRENVKNAARADALGAIEEALSRELDGLADFSAQGLISSSPVPTARTQF